MNYGIISNSLDNKGVPNCKTVNGNKIVFLNGLWIYVPECGTHFSRNCVVQFNLHYDISGGGDWSSKIM